MRFFSAATAAKPWSAVRFHVAILAYRSVIFKKKTYLVSARAAIPFSFF
jgi:hypothetical protein